MTTRDIRLLNATYSDVPAVQLPIDPSGTATFYEISDTTATSDDVADGDIFYSSAGARTVGNAKYAGAPVNNGNATQTNAILYGIVDNTSTSTAFTATVTGLDSYYDGVTVLLKNGKVTSASGFTININGLGAKPVYNNMAAASAETTIFNVNYTMLFVYDSTRVAGGCWICYRGYNSDTNTIGYQLRTNSTAMPVSDTARYYKIYFTQADGTKWVPASVNSTNNATTARTVNQRPIDPFGRIAYTSASTNYTAGTNLAAATTWSQYNLTLGYSFNRTGAALTLTTSKPVYIKCAPQSDGSAIIDADNPYVQALPSTADGKIYIFLGIATSATAVEMYINHPVYEYKDGSIRLYTNTFVPTQTSQLANDSGFITGYTETDPVFSASAAAGITSGDISSWNGKQNAIIKKTITITTADWGGTTSCTIADNDVTALSTVIVSYNPTSKDNYVSADIYCSAQAAGTLAFTCSTTPTVDIDVNIMIMN